MYFHGLPYGSECFEKVSEDYVKYRQAKLSP